jgi:hypothetical protein
MKYYSDQCGAGMNVFQGARGQRGHGLGSMLSGLFRSAWPILKNFGLSIGKAFGRKVLETGANVVSDVVSGTKVQESMDRRVPEGLKEFTGTNFGQTGSGKRRGRSSKKKPLKRLKSDIFH